ncbi:MAG: FAD-dependent oxidoreductase, partial [Candidatus Caldatribacteriaceae bacterium]
MNFDVIIIGGGISGLKTAEYLSNDLKVAIIEENIVLGGLALQLGCKATSECLYCGVCRALELKRRKPQGTVLLPRNILEIQRKGTTFSVKTNREVLEGGFLVIATGASPFDARKMSNFGWQKIPNVYTGFELEANLNQGILQRLGRFEKVAFVQCVGSRGFKEKRDYCSQVCCRYALRLAEDLLFLNPQLEIDFYYMDLQILGNKAAKLQEISQKVHLIRKIPFEAQSRNGQVWLKFEGKKGVEGNIYDVVILSVGMVPSPGTRKVGEMLQLDATSGGFICNYG